MSDELNKSTNSQNSQSYAGSFIIAGGLIISTIIGATTYNKVSERQESITPKLVTQINYDGGMSRIGYLEKINEVIEVSVDSDMNKKGYDYTDDIDTAINLLEKSLERTAKRLNAEKSDVVYTKPFKVELTAATKYYGTVRNHTMLDYEVEKTFPEDSRAVDIIQWVKDQESIAKGEMSLSPLFNTELVHGKINF